MSILQRLYDSDRAWISLAAYGMGVDSTGGIIGMLKRGERPPHAIIAADTEAEKLETYEYRELFSTWLVREGWPPITIVKKAGENLEQDCLRRKALPSVAYGMKTCSQRFKIEPQDKWANNDPVCKNEWESGRKVTKIIFYDWDEAGRAHFYDDPKYEWRYPLLDWKWGRIRCEQEIKSVGLPIPPKSACFYCPNSKPAEVRWLARNHPDLLERALKMEANADLKSVRGLGRNFSWRDVVNQGEMFPEIYDKQMSEMPCGCYDGAAP